MEVEADPNVFAILRCFAAPDALVIVRKKGHIREALRFDAGFRLALSKAIRAGYRTTAPRACPAWKRAAGRGTVTFARS
jgi:Tfp pilus assembly protein FimT